MADIRVSVVVPARNEADTIEACLKAIFSQSHRPHEVILVDGHSADGTVEKARAFPAKILYEDYHTRAGACQVGVEDSEGEYVAFTDADCIPDKDWLANLLMEFGDDIAGVGGGMKNVDTDFWGRTMNLVYDSFLGGAELPLARLFKKKQFVRTIGGLNSIYRKKDLIKAGGFDVKISGAEDLETSTRVRKIGKLIYTPQAIVFHDHRRGLKEFARQTYRYAAWRRESRIWHVQEFLALLIPVSLVAFLPLTYWVLLGEAIFYLLVLTAMGIKTAIWEKDIRYLFSIPLVYALEHSCFVWGFWRNLIWRWK